MQPNARYDISNGKQTTVVCVSDVAKDMFLGNTIPGYCGNHAPGHFQDLIFLNKMLNDKYICRA